MIKYRESKIIRAICFLMAITILVTSCSNNNNNLNVECIPIANGLEDQTEIAHYFENALELTQTLRQTNEYSSLDEYYQDIYGISSENNQALDLLKEQYTLYGQMGINSYLDHVEQNEFITTELKNFYLTFVSEIENVIEANLELEELITYLDTYISTNGINFNLCPSDLKKAEIYIEYIKGYSNFKYEQQEGIGLRGCNFIEAFFCGLLAVTVGVVVTVVIWVPLMIITIITSKGKDGDSSIIRDLLLVAYSTYLAVAVGLDAGISVYDWCCGIEEQECEEPTGSYVTQLSCNEHKFGFYGPSDYGTTVWVNSNVTPASIITPTPNFNFSVPTFGDPSTFSAAISCMEGASVPTIYQEEKTLTIESDNDFFPLGWQHPPPFSATYTDSGTNNIPTGDFELENNVYAKLNTPSNETMSYNWSISAHQIVAGGGANDNYISVRLQSTANLTISVVATNNCTNQSESLSRTTLVN